MSTNISDPLTGTRSRVTSQGKLETYSIVTDDKVYATEQGEAFIIISPIMELTDDNETALIYLKNTAEDIPILITEMTFITTASDVGSDKDYTINLLKNPLGGTLIDNTEELNIFNLNTNSGNELLITTKAGGTGITVGNATEPVFTRLVVGTGNTRQFTTPISLPKGGSIAISINPPVGNTSMKIQINTDIHVKSVRSGA